MLKSELKPGDVIQDHTEHTLTEADFAPGGCVEGLFPYATYGGGAQYGYVDGQYQRVSGWWWHLVSHAT